MESLPAQPAFKGKSVAALFCTILAFCLLGFSFERFISTERAAIQMPRAFLQFERAIGYDGFIHNFKNYILRPDEAAYRARAMEDLDKATAALETIQRLTGTWQLNANLQPIDDVLASYRAMLDKTEIAKQNGLSVREVDKAVRVSDTDAARAIRQVEAEIDAFFLKRSQTVKLVVLSTAAFAALILTVIFYLQHERRRQAERTSRRLAEQERQLHHAERIAGLGRWTSDEQGHLSWSETTMQIYGVSPESFDGTAAFFWNLVPPEDHEKLRTSVQKAYREKRAFVCVHRVIRPDGEIRTLCQSGEPILNESGIQIGAAGTVQDVSEMISLKEKLRQSQKMEVVGNLAGGLAHDFNNLLAVILGNLELAQETDEPKKIQPYLEAAIRATKRGAGLTKNMLSFARRSTLQPVRTDMNSIIQESTGWSTRLIPANIEIKTTLAPDPWQIEVDQSLAQNAVINLLINARDAMPDGGRLTIETTNTHIDADYIFERDEEIEPGPYVIVSVTDTGIGIPKEHVRQIFEPFFTTKPPNAGSGLGLSMVIGFMKQSGGSVRVYSEVGVGTTFRLYFKAMTAPDVTPDPRRMQGPSDGAQASVRVLLVDDNQDLLEVYREALVSRGFEIATARSGDEAFATWAETKAFDVIVTDQVMPGSLQGVQLAQRIREDCPDMPFIFMSGYAHDTCKTHQTRRIEDTILMKPINRLDLVEAIVNASRTDLLQDQRTP